MHPIIYLNNVMVEATKARVAPLSYAMLYGRGVFTTVAVYYHAPFLWPKHWEQLVHDAEHLQIDCSPYVEKTTREAVQKVIAVNNVEEGCARVVLLARSGRDLRKSKGAKDSDLLIMSSERQIIPAAGLTLAISPFRANTLSPLVGIKSVNYLERVLALEEAQEREFDEAVVLNERGEVVSAIMANIFWVKDGTVHTPALSTGALPGMTRAATIDLAEKHFIPLVEGVYELSDLTDADEIFLTSANLGVAIVTTFDFRQYSVAIGSVAARLFDSFRALVDIS